MTTKMTRWIGPDPMLSVVTILIRPNPPTVALICVQYFPQAHHLKEGVADTLRAVSDNMATTE